MLRGFDNQQVRCDTSYRNLICKNRANKEVKNIDKNVPIQLGFFPKVISVIQIFKKDIIE